MLILFGHRPPFIFFNVTFCFECFMPQNTWLGSLWRIESSPDSASSICSIFSYCFRGHTSLAWTEASPRLRNTTHRLQGRHLLQVQTNRARTSLWALVFTIIAACCSQGNLNLNNRYLKRHKPFPWEPGKSAGDLTWPFVNASVLSSPPFWVTNAVPFRELAWKITWIWSCWPDTTYLAGRDFLALLLMLHSRGRRVLANRIPYAWVTYGVHWQKP